MDVWGPARVRGQGHERYFLLVVDDYSRYTTVFPLRSKGEVTEVLIDWIRAARLQLRESFGSDIPVLRLHSDRGGEFSSARLGAFCRAQGIRQTFTLPASPQQNGIAERRIGMVMDVARTSMIHAAAPHFLWPFAVQYAAHQLNLQPRVFLPETSPTLLWTGKVGDVSAFRFYHPTSRRVLSSQDVTFDESVPYYRLFPYRTAPLPPPPLFLAPGPPPVDPLPPQGPAPSGVSQVDAVEPVEVAGDSGAATGAEPAGAGPGGAESGGAASGGAEPRGAESGGAELGGAEPCGAEPRGAGSTRVASRGVSSRRELLSPQELREWFARRWSRAAGAAGPGGAAGAAGVSPAGGSAGASGGAGAAGPAGTRAAGATGAGATGGVGAGGSAGSGSFAGAGVGAVGAGVAAGAGAAAGSPGAVPAGSGGATRPRPYFVPLLEQVLGLPPSPGPPPPLECPRPVQSQSQFQPVSPLPAPSPYTGPTGGLAERRAPASRPASPARSALTSRRASCPRPPAVPGIYQIALRPSTAPLRVPLLSPPASSLPVLADPESDSLHAASPAVARLLATVVTDPSFESAAASALVAELVDFAARCRQDYAASNIAESAPICPPSVGDPDAPDIPTPRSYAEAIEGPYSSQWQAAMDAEMASWKSTGTYVDEVPPPGANIVIGMWIFRVKRPPGSPPVFNVRYVARGFSQRQGVDYFQTFSPTPKMTTLWVLLHVAAQCDYELHSLDFSTAFLQGSLHEEIWLRRPPGFTGSFPPGTQWSLRRPVYGLRQAPREWHDTLRTTLAALGFAPSTADPSLFLRTDTSLPPFYVLVYVDDLVFATAGLAHVKSKLQKRHTCTDLGELRNYLGLQITRDRAQRTITLTQSHISGSAAACAPASCRRRSTATRLCRCPAVIFLVWVLGVHIRSHTARLEHRTKHIALRYFLARELQQRGQLCLAYVASEANTADIFTKALPPGDHQRFCTMLACFVLLCLTGLVSHWYPNIVLVHSFLFLHSAVLGGAVLGGAEPGGAEPGGAEPWGAEPGGAEPGGALPWGATPGFAAHGGAELRGAPPGGSPGASSLREPISPQELREWFARRWRRAAGAGGSSATEGAAVAGPGGARTVSTGAAGPASSTGAGAAEGVGTETTAGGPAGGTPGAAGGFGAAGGAAGEGAPAGGTGAVPAVSGVAARPRPYFVPLREQVLGSPPSAGLPPSLACPQPVPSQLQLQLTSPLPAPSPYTGPTGGLAERREPASRPASPARAARASGRGSRQRPPPVPGMHRMSLRPSTAPLRAPLPSPPESSLPALANPESDSLRAASPTVTRLLATVVTDPSFESTAASALVAELVDFAACCRLDYAASLVAESESVCPPSVGGECALGTDALEDKQEDFQCLAAASPHLVSVLLTPEGDPDALDIPTPRSYAEAIEGTYVDAVPPPGANIVSGMWIFRVKRPPGSPPVFKARYVACGFSQRQGVDYFHTFGTAFLQGSLHEEIWLRRPLGFTGTFPPGTQWSLRRPVYGLRQAPREWHDTLRTTLAALGFAPSTVDPSLFLRTDTSLPPFYILVYVDDLVFATADTAGLAHVKSELQKRHTCTDLGELRSYLGLQITRDRACRTITLTQSHMVQQVFQRFGFTYSSPQATPLSTRHSLSALPSDESVESSGL
ncbi:unnamed protein product [Closterium sp. NIES-53]